MDIGADYATGAVLGSQFSVLRKPGYSVEVSINQVSTENWEPVTETLLQRMQVRQQIFDLLVVHHLPEAFHF